MEKSREEIKNEREAKKLAKQAKKQKKGQTTDENKVTDVAPAVKPAKKELKLKSEKPQEEIKTPVATPTDSKPIPTPNVDDKSNKKLKEHNAKDRKRTISGNKDKTIKTDLEKKLLNKSTVTKEISNMKDPKTTQKVEIEKQQTKEENATEKKEGKTMTKAERRAIQEAQRAAKAQKLNEKVAKIEKTVEVKKAQVVVEKVQVIKKVGKTLHPKVKLFSHLYEDKINLDNFISIPNVHPAVIKLGVQYATRTVAGSNARCRAFLEAMREVIYDYETPAQQQYSRGLETQIHQCVNFLKQCRSMSVSMINALKAIKRQLTHLDPSFSDTESRSVLLETIDTYVKDQIEKAAQAISISVQEKISNGDVILTFACSSLIQHILLEAHRRKVDFRVIVVDARPLNEGQEMLRRLVSQGINCISVLINAIAFIMPEVTKVMLGAHALLANGYVTSRAGTAQIALVAKAFNVPVLVCCETHKFSDRVQTDGFVYNEIGDPDDLFRNNTSTENNKLPNWESMPYLTPLHLFYDVTPPELVTAVVTEVAILPCTSVPVILRIKPSDIMY